MDVVLLSRIQFGLHSAFHYIYPPMSIGLGLMLVIMEGMYMATKNPWYKEMTKFWAKVFALTFALGVATGLVQIFGFGTNWARYSYFIGDVFGSALGAEGIFAFFLEAGFLGVMLFGWDRVRPSFHYLSTILVAIGAHMSAIWIVVANSWMQTPRGYTIIGEGKSARAVVTNFWEMIFNYSSVERITHVTLGCWLTGTFLVTSVAAYYFLRRRHLEFARTSMKVGLYTGFVVVLLQLVSADSTARGVSRNQPAKLAAIEGVFETQADAPMALIGWVDTKEQKVKGIKVPGLLSFLVWRNVNKPVTGLDSFPKNDWPNVATVFQTYHLMIYMWSGMFLISVLGIFYQMRKKLDKARWLLWGFVFAVVFPQIANEAGWFTTEMGRQPWLVYNVLRTADGVSTNISATQVSGSISMFVVIFILLFVLFIYLLNHKIKHGPDEPEHPTIEPEPMFEKMRISHE